MIFEGFRMKSENIKLSTQPGPIPGMRPPMGAGSNHQANHKGNSLGFIMPLYTVGIVAFFVYTVMKVYSYTVAGSGCPHLRRKNK